MVCNYQEEGLRFDYTWAKDGVTFHPSIGIYGDSIFAVVPVPNGEYLSSLEGTYTCRVSLGVSLRGSRNIIVSLPGN